MDLVEIFLFILSKKIKQVTILHVLHHVSINIIAWFVLNYTQGSMITYPGILNGFVHVLMYSYNLCANWGRTSLLGPVKP